nr:hypothetical protein BaRGS_022263 [Batillaria attramentaria]
MARSSTVPELLVEDVMLPFGIPRADINFNINEDDLDCPGQHGPRGLCFNSSSDTLYDSSEEDMEVRTRTRAMSVDDEAYLKLGDSDHEDDSNGNSATTASSVRFMLTPLPLEEELEDGDSPEETELDDTPNTPLGLEYPKTRSGSFFRLQRRASFDNGVFGMPDRIARGDLVVDVSERNALTAPATPADPSTPKERDLELAARIGQTLLSKNKELNGRGELLEDQLTHANEKDLQDESSGDTTPSEGIAGLSKINIEMLQRKVGTLEEENLNLRLETAQLRSATENYEDKEKKLVEDCLEQLAEVNQQVETFAGELRIKSEESARQKEEITGLLAQVADLHKRLTIENMDLAEKLQASQESQRQLTKELSIQHDKYDELFEMLEQAQDELRGHRSRNNPRATRHRYLSAALPTATGAMDSLASELQNSLQQEESEEKEKSLKDPFSQNPSNVPSDSESFNSDGYSADMDSIYGHTGKGRLDSTASPASGYSYLGFGQQQSASHFKIPDKLQIVKPLEGSVTLRHWQRLAQPHLGGLFEQREGVQVRGERKLDLEGEVYTLSDFEEDGADVMHTWQRLETAAGSEIRHAAS